MGQGAHKVKKRTSTDDDDDLEKLLVDQAPEWVDFGEFASNSSAPPPDNKIRQCSQEAKLLCTHA